jgi:hypothetical protein
MTTLEELDSFYDFASTRLRSTLDMLSMDEIYLIWRARHPIECELNESIASVKSAYADLEAGETGRPAREALEEVCRELGLAIDE